MHFPSLAKLPDKKIDELCVEKVWFMVSSSNASLFVEGPWLNPLFFFHAPFSVIWNRSFFVCHSDPQTRKEKELKRTVWEINSKNRAKKERTQSYLEKKTPDFMILISSTIYVVNLTGCALVYGLVSAEEPWWDTLGSIWEQLSTSRESSSVNSGWFCARTLPRIVMVSFLLSTREPEAKIWLLIFVEVYHEVWGQNRENPFQSSPLRFPLRAFADGHSYLVRFRCSTFWHITVSSDLPCKTSKQSSHGKNNR